MEGGSERTPLLVQKVGGDAPLLHHPAGAAFPWGKRVFAVAVMCVATVCIAFGAVNVKSVMKREGLLFNAGGKVDPLVPVFFPFDPDNIIVNVHIKDVPSSGADETWDAAFLEKVASSTDGVEVSALTMRDVVYKMRVELLVSGVDCTLDGMLQFQDQLKGVLGVTPAVDIEDCTPVTGREGVFSVPMTVAISRTSVADPSAVMKSLGGSLSTKTFPSGAKVEEGSTAELSAVAVVEGPPAIEDLEKKLNPVPNPATDTGDILDLPDNLVRSDVPFADAGRPPYPGLPPDAFVHKIPVTFETAQLEVAANPQNFLPLPPPLTPGNEVVSLPTTNTPDAGFSEKQLQMVKGNKARNAKMDADELIIREFHYTVAGSIQITNSRCKDGKFTAIFEHALRDAFYASEMTDRPDHIDSQYCVDKPPDEDHDLPYTRNNFYLTKNRKSIEGTPLQFAEQAVKVLQDADLFTVLQHAIEESEENIKPIEWGDSSKNAGCDMELFFYAPKMLGYIILEGPAGSGEKLLKSNGPVV